MAEVEDIAKQAADDSRGLVSQLLELDERSMVIVGAARLDAALQLALGSMMSDGSASSRLFSPDGPLGSLAAKIELASCLGLLDSDVARAARLVKKIRNDFAHSCEDESLFVARHADRLGAACESARRTNYWTAVRNALPKKYEDDPRVEFVMLVAVVVALLEAVARCQQPVKAILAVSFKRL